MSNPRAVDMAELQTFAVREINEGRANLAKAIQGRFAVSRPTAHNYIRDLIAAEIIVRTGIGRYALASNLTSFRYQVSGLAEHEVWERDVAPLLTDLPKNLVDIWHYGCTEMINNVVDHSESLGIVVEVTRTPELTRVVVTDRGVGIFRKIASALNLEDDRHAVLELSKGKVTTDPEKHTGEGIFFSSRTFDAFQILSGQVYFSHDHHDDEDWIPGDETHPETVSGTTVFMTMSNNSEKDIKEVFDAYATDTEDYRFDKTVVPVKLLEYGDDRLVSRSQAKRLMNRFDRFRTVVLNFEDVESIGQAFADEVFRVFPSQHPEVEVVPIKANEQVSRMINRAKSNEVPQRDLFNK